MTSPLVLQVSVIKVKIHEATGMPAGKQKLQYEVSRVSGPAFLGPKTSALPEAKSPVERKELGDTWVWPSESIIEVTMLAGSARAG